MERTQGVSAVRRSVIVLATAAVVVSTFGPAPAGAAPGKPKAANGNVCTVVGTAGNDRLSGTSRNDVICGLGGNDALVGNSGNDILDGGPGNDSFVGGTGGDTYLGGAGVDTVSYAAHTVPVIADIDNVADDGGPGERDRIITDVENVTGGAKNDRLTGSGGANVLRGGSGNDVLTGYSGDDTLDGSTGDDTLDGGDGDDTLEGGPGADDLDGGNGLNSCKRDSLDVSPADACSDLQAPTVDPSSIAWVGPTTFTNNQVNTVRIRYRLLDDRSGVQDTGIQLMPPGAGGSGQSRAGQLISGTRWDGVWESAVDLPRYTQTGEWRLLAVYTLDRVNQTGGITANEGSYVTYPAQTPVSIVLPPLIVTGEADLTPPVIDGSTFTWLEDPHVSVDEPHTVPLRVRVSDAQSGVKEIYASIGPPGSDEFTASTVVMQRPTRVSGSEYDGVWEASVDVRRYARTGDWRLIRFCAYDENTNRACYLAQPDGSYRTVAGEPISLDLAPLVLTGTRSDVDAPVFDVTSFAWQGENRVHNDVENTVVLRADVSDDLSGIDQMNCGINRVGVPGGIAGAAGQLIHGTVNDGTWEFSIRLPKYTPAAEYVISGCTVRDRVGNSTGFGANEDGTYSSYDWATYSYTGPAVELSLAPLVVLETSLSD